MRNLFFYGTLCYRPLLDLVLEGAAHSARPANLADHAVYWAKDQIFPMIRPEAGAHAAGMLVTGLTEKAIARLDHYEGGFAYQLATMQVESNDGRHDAEVYFPEEGLWSPGVPWSLEDWAAEWGEITLVAAEEVISYMGRLSVKEVADRFQMIRLRAASKVRARATPSPADLRSSWGPDRVQVAHRSRPYTNYFALEEEDLSFPRFDGAMSPLVNRAAFVGGDAVTVLPYDPKRDAVLVVEQFRIGPYMRGDLHPWVLEPIAGRIDPGEGPEETARREAVEEANLTIGDLEHVGNYYPTPGAVTEYLYSYVALCDLPEDAAGLGGMLGEAEDIRSHVISFERLMELVRTGEADNAPLLLSAYWLMQNRDRLRGPS
ncbi:gamma-glutamylcyclotransferase [Aliiroseovarius sp. KMU-50]|uniref:ADP-ribose pyrophosphatase n=1 Tax=Aliiroseovarius salicola TaxID=3009082 RepID=A0ABT4W2C8_9RHOB|nr:NUDIX domain-containing protein [Aliiroseovarius sp. KMU-50]MDA5094681.1 gamma-glutamylcyclotransferase [Aliiroseovarius sp. KMU-50]